MSSVLLDYLDSLDIEIPRGKSWEIEIALTEDDGVTPIDLSDWTPRGQIRQYEDGPLFADFGFNTDEAADGVIRALLTPTQTRAVTKLGVYDIELVSGSNVIGALHGAVTKLISEVTQP